MNHKWFRVKKGEPCPICKHTDWCTVSEIGVCCMRIQSKRSLGNGGWLHVVGEKPIKPLPKKEAPKVKIDCEAMLETWGEQTSQSQISDFAQSLGVTPESLIRLGCCRSPSHQAWAFPMRDGSSRIIGIRLRFDNGDKRAVTGSQSGLFIPMSEPQSPCFICEGPTDTAAALSMGIFTIGRPSCSGGTAQLYHAIKERKIMRVVIVSDNDQDKTRPDGERYNPGFDGASRLADELNVATCIYVPPCKDIRELLNLGGTKSFIESSLNSLVWNQPKRRQPDAHEQHGTILSEQKFPCQADSFS